MINSKFTRVLIAGATLALMPAPADAGHHLDAAALKVLRTMSDKIKSAEELTVSANRQMSPLLLENENQIGNAKIEAVVARPDRVKVSVRSWTDERLIYLSRRGSAIWDKRTDFYARFPGKATIDASLDAAIDQFGVFVPMQDLLSGDPYDGFTEGLTSLKHAGVESAGLFGPRCDRITGTKEGLQFDLWVSQADGLPSKMVITATALEGTGHLQIRSIRWNLNPELHPGTFTFAPPEGSTEIQFLKE
jgi:hypothetical protein